MIALNAHFDGKVIVPDEPLALAPHQAVRILLLDADAPNSESREHGQRFADWLGLARPLGALREPLHQPDDEDRLWDEGMLPPTPQRGDAA